MNKFLIMAVLLLGMVIIDIQHSSIATLRERVTQQNAVLSQTRSDARLAVKLIQTSEWYVIDINTVSSKPEGSGELVKLDRELQAQGNRMGIKHPTDKGQKVVFSATDSTMIAYPIAGGALTYKYL